MYETESSGILHKGVDGWRECSWAPLTPDPSIEWSPELLGTWPFRQCFDASLLIGIDRGKQKKQYRTYGTAFSLLLRLVTLCAALFGFFLVNSLDGERKLGLSGAGVLADIHQLDLDFLAYLQVIAHLCHSCRA